MSLPARDTGLAGDHTSRDAHWQQLRALSFASFRFVLPLGWEVTAYLLTEARGQLRFHLREVFIAQLDWHVVETTPDQAEIMRAVDARCSASEQADARAALHTTQRGPWLIGEGAERVYASLLQPSTGALLQWAFPAPHAQPRARLHELLDSYAPNAGAARAFELFGVRVRLPSACAFVRLRAQPADVSVQWSLGRARQLVARRIGMARVILADRSLAQFAELLLRADGARVERTEEHAWLGQPGLRVTFQRRAERGLDTLIGRAHRGEAQLWHDEHEGRIYALAQWGPAHARALAFDGMWGPPPPAASQAGDSS